MNKSIYIVVLFLCTLNLSAQDWHFAQFNRAPLLINAANAGSYGGDYRLDINYRNQWGTVGSAYKTMSASYDAPIIRNVDGFKQTGIGISFLSDKAGKSNYGITQANISLSQSVAISRYQDWSMGLSFGYGQISANYANLRWDKQWNGAFHDPNLSAGEIGFRESNKYIDVSAGFLARFFNEQDRQTQIGLSVGHLTTPWQGTLTAFNNDWLRLRYNLHGNKEFSLTSDGIYVLMANFLYTKQSSSDELLIGANLMRKIGLHSKYTAYHKPSFAYIGANYRVGDAIIPILAYQWRSALRLGFSYDITVSGLTKANNALGAMELSISWIGSYLHNERSVETIRKTVF